MSQLQQAGQSLHRDCLHVLIMLQAIVNCSVGGAGPHNQRRDNEARHVALWSTQPHKEYNR